MSPCKSRSCAVLYDSHLEFCICQLNLSRQLAARSDSHVTFEPQPMVLHDRLCSTVIAVDQGFRILKLFWHGLALYGAI